MKTNYFTGRTVSYIILTSILNSGLGYAIVFLNPEQILKIVAVEVKTGNKLLFKHGVLKSSILLFDLFSLCSSHFLASSCGFLDRYSLGIIQRALSTLCVNQTWIWAKGWYFQNPSVNRKEMVKTREAKSCSSCWLQSTQVSGRYREDKITRQKPNILFSIYSWYWIFEFSKKKNWN